MAKKVIGVLTGGGDCPGLNAAIKAVVKKAIEIDYEVRGIREGWFGLTNQKQEPMHLDRDVVRHIDRQGGTILGTSRTNPFKIDNGPNIVVHRMAESPCLVFAGTFHNRVTHAAWRSLLERAFAVK